MTALLNITALTEGRDLECKKAAGRDGQGEVPLSFYETYSAMANTGGGVVLLGVEEKPRGTFTLLGIGKPERVLSDLWNQLNNPQKVSVNLLTDDMVEVLDEQGKKLIRVRIPRAKRQHRPVFLNGNPLTGTYRRNNEGDYLCTEETVRRMLAEQVEDNRDARLLPGFDFKDIHQPTLDAYRNRLRSTKPTHPFLDENDQEMLRQLGGWGRDRDDGREGLTLAGLLMFGKLRSILDVVPHYIVDYQEWPGPAAAESRWIDRVTTDGTWSGNVYDFYRQIYPKLTADLKVPFQLKGDRRIDDTPVHEAVREALVNALIHADYTGRVSILVVKRPGLFGFRNPGTMRLPLEDALLGGTSDCRNRNMQKMFQLVGLGEQAGSGIPKINRNWQQQHWRLPELRERLEPDQTLLTMRMISLLPPEVLDALEKRFGAPFRELSETQRLALATVAIEGLVTHSRLRAMTDVHPKDLTRELGELVTEQFLETAGATRGTRYYFPGEAPEETGEVLDFAGQRAFTGDLFSSLAPPAETAVHSGTSSVHSGASSVHSGAMPAEEWTRRMALARAIRDSGRAAPDAIRAIILQVSDGYFLSREQLAELLGRSDETLRTHYLNPMVEQGQLELEFPAKRSHPKQRYRTKKS